MARVMHLLAAGLLLGAGCGDNASRSTEDASPPVNIDAGIADAGAIDAACFDNPETHLEIINGCTTAQKLIKNPTLPLRLPDGGLPQLP